MNGADIELLKQALSGKLPMNVVTMEINGDNVVNTRDLIELIKLVRGRSFPNSQVTVPSLQSVVTTVRRP